MNDKCACAESAADQCGPHLQAHAALGVRGSKSVSPHRSGLRPHRPGWQRYLESGPPSPQVRTILPAMRSPHSKAVPSNLAFLCQTPPVVPGWMIELHWLKGIPAT